MGKISPVAAKYIVKAEVNAKGVVEKPDIIGAVFGQTEGLLGSELELRELQKSGRIGRIEVQMETKNGRTKGIVELPSSMDKAETAIIAAALETIDRVGPCEAKVKVVSVEDVRERKRKYITDRAKDILKDLLMKGPDSQEILGEITKSVRQAEVQFYGPNKLPAGPAVDSSEEVIIVEGRADVLNLLRHGIKNVICLDGKKQPKEIIKLSKEKIVTLFVDGDRGGDLIVKELLMAAELDFVAHAPDGKEVEELTQKEILKALRGKEPAEQVREHIGVVFEGTEEEPAEEHPRRQNNNRRNDRNNRSTPSKKRPNLTDEEKEQFKKLLDDLVGTRGAYLLRESEILGKVPTVELGRYLEILKADTVVMDGEANKRIASICRSHGVERIIATSVDGDVRGVEIFVKSDLGDKK